MEMPEGWLKAKQDAELEINSKFSEFVPSGQNFLRGLELMKEMAEAMELVEKHFGSNPIIWLALEKFKEWK